MSAKPEIPADDQVTLTIDGRELKARKGAMLIEVADAAGIVIPRFCYHKKLAVAANCRMCLVQVEKAPKPMPACATPVMEGMQVFTKSDYAKNAQRAVMEFLLINHPLDCPICDQGGECELQDLALGYGRSISRFTEKKRVVKDKNIGPLIATDMTRCIHCTRCIRFLQDIAGQKELGATGRGQHTEIGTYVERSIESEMSGNVIDVCPVGALTSKPYRFRARAWELTGSDAVSPHDSMGSNLTLHVRRGQVMRVVPRENEEINEVWLCDRDRFSYQGMYAGDRLQSPMIKRDGEWQETDWETALQAAVDGLKQVKDNSSAEQIGMLASPNATLEELYLLRRIADTLGCNNLDHRLRRRDFSGQDHAPLFPWLGQHIEELEAVDAALLIGSNVRKEQPIAAHRLRKAGLKGAKIMFINPVDYDFTLPVAHKSIVSPAAMVATLAGVAKALAEIKSATLPAELQKLIAGDVQPDKTQQAIAGTLKEAGNATILLGNTAAAHPASGALIALAGWIAEQSGARLGYLPEAANSVGAWLAGVLPHRGPMGARSDAIGLNARTLFEQPRKAYVLMGLEPEYDCADPATANKALAQAEFVLSLSPYAGEELKKYATVLLPVAMFAETSGTYVNAEGRWQSFTGAGQLLGAARPGWKILRVLGNLLGMQDCEYDSSAQVRDELRAKLGDAQPDNRITSGAVNVPEEPQGLQRIGDVPMYKADMLVRRAEALQQTTDAQDAMVRLCPAQAQSLGLQERDAVMVKQGEASARMNICIDARVPAGCAWIPAACPATLKLGPAFGSVELQKV